MAIRYALYPNTFRRRKPQQNYVARVHHTQSCDQKMLVEMITHHNRALPPTMVEAVLEEYYRAVEWAIEDGMRVNTPLIKIQASIQGTFAEEDERMYPGRQRIVLKAVPGKRLRSLIKRLKAQKVAPKYPCPEPKQLEDIFSDTSNRSITAGGIIRLRGKRLKFDPEDIQQGIFLIQAGGTKPIRLAKAVTNTPSQLLMKAPDDLPAGEYTLEVHAIVGNSTEIRYGKLPHALTVIQS